MFVLTLNRRRGTKIIAAALAVVFIAGVGAGVKNFLFKDRRTSAAAADLTMESTRDMAAYISRKGYTVDLQSARVNEVRIPKTFDAEFENFNRKIMQTDGLSLEKYKNDKVNKWTFDIIDYEVKDKTAVAVLLVKKDELIGAYLLQMPEGIACPLVKNQTRTDELG